MKMTRNMLTVVMMMAAIGLWAGTAGAGLIGHWSFDEGSGSTAVDSSANGNDATQSIAAGGWIAGKAGGAGGLKPGAVHNRMVRQPDFLPTLLDIVGIDSGECGDIAGRSFKPLIDGEPWEARPAFVSVSGCQTYVIM